MTPRRCPCRKWASLGQYPVGLGLLLVGLGVVAGLLVLFIHRRGPARVDARIQTHRLP